MKRLVTTLTYTAIYLFTITLTACTAAPASPIPSATPTAEAGIKVIPFFTSETDPAQIAVLQELVAEYQKINPDVEIDIVLVTSASRGRRMLSAFASGADLGIFEIEPTLMTDWAEAGYLLPLDEVAKQIGEDDFVTGSVFTYQGKVYALPYANSVYGLWVRTDWLSEAGLSLPKNYDEVLFAAKTLTKGDRYGIALPAGQNIATVNYFSTFLWQNSADYFNCDGKVTFGEPAALEAIKRWKALTQYAPPGYTTWSYPEQIEAFIKGRVGMAMYGGRLGVQLVATAPQLEDKVTVIFPPWGNEKVTLGVWSRFAIAAGTKNKTEAKAFLKWLITGDRLVRYDMTVPGHMIPPLRSVQAAILTNKSNYVTRHSDWIRAFNEWSALTNHPAMNMGSLRNGHFQRSDIVPPWGQQVFGTPGIVDSMLQDITLDKIEPERAWREASGKMNETAKTWQAAHPAWKAGCKPQ